MVKSILVAAMLTLLFILAISAKADARTHHRRAAVNPSQAWGWASNNQSLRRHTHAGKRYAGSRPHSSRHHARGRAASPVSKRPVRDANGNLATIVTKAGHTAKVRKDVQEQFQGFINALEQPLVMMEPPFLVVRDRVISEIGCHVRRSWGGSLHNVGLACDVAQISRDRTRDWFMYEPRTNRIAQEFGLVHGAIWDGGGRRGGPDTGHIQVAQYTNAYAIPRTRTASAKRKHHRRYASR